MNHPTWPPCQQDQSAINRGLNHADSQRYRYQVYRCSFTPAPKSEDSDVSVHIQALMLQLEGTSLRAIGRLLGLHHQTESNWITQAANTLPFAITHTTPAETIE